ncbi:hypothetical protein LC1Hm_0455 [Halomicrobium sp. LC1Hm]|nr:hypothetical protein LC1Hm_0455 [Halomicrobium sp. LC1Hm]
MFSRWLSPHSSRTYQRYRRTPYAGRESIGDARSLSRKEKILPYPRRIQNHE